MLPFVMVFFVNMLKLVDLNSQMIHGVPMGPPSGGPGTTGRTTGGKRSTPSSVKRRSKVARRDSAKRILAYNSQR
jgi:hypothetical protein